MRRHVPPLLLNLLVPFALSADERPNIIVIYTDDQGFADASCYHPASKIGTPNLDRPAAGGVRFTDAHCSDTVCTPSRYGLLTGRYSWRTELKQGVFGAARKGLIADGRMTRATLLRDQGYATGMVGKWHLGMDYPGDQGARDKGFDAFFGLPAPLNDGAPAWRGSGASAAPGRRKPTTTTP